MYTVLRRGPIWNTGFASAENDSLFGTELICNFIPCNTFTQIQRQKEMKERHENREHTIFVCIV